MFATIADVVEKYGYEQYDAPVIESTDLYRVKGSSEIINEQSYTFEDRGGRSVTLRTEMTPSVSRMVAAKRQHLNYPLRWYSIPNLWRYERPQRGRLREFWQLNVDLFGDDSIESEVEVIQIADAILKAFGAEKSMYTIKLNSRMLVDYIFRIYLQLDSVQTDTIKKIIESLRSIGVTNIEFDAGLMRGFDYYTDIVFEVFDTNPNNNRSMYGGGRYDGLVEAFGVQKVPTVGFGMGDVTLENFLRDNSLIPPMHTETELYVVLAPESNLVEVNKKLAILREENVRVAVDYTKRKVGKQIETAVKKGIPYCIVMGEKELKDNFFTLKNLHQNTESSHSLERIISMIKA